MRTMHLVMRRPDKLFFEGDVLRLYITQNDSTAVEILPGHIPMVMRLKTDMARFVLTDGSERYFASGDGILNIERDRIVILSDFMAWEEKLDAAINHRQRSIAEEVKRRRQSFTEYRLNKIEMTKAFIKLRKMKH